MIPQNVHWLVPEENCPCDIFLHFRGQFPKALSAGQPVGFSVLEKLAKVKCHQVYIRESDQGLWKNWVDQRLRKAGHKEEPLAQDSEIYGNKRAELLSYLQRALQQKDGQNEELRQAFSAGHRALQKVVHSPILDWYFHQFHEPPDLFHHTGRVALGAAVFAFHHKLAVEKEVETMIFAALVHELQGDPATSLNTVVSQQTLAVLQKARHPVPADVITLIQAQDELCSGQGFPDNRKKDEIPLLGRAFTLFNHLDHHRLKAGSSRRARLEHARKKMTERRQDYDDALWGPFWDFIDKQVELLS